MPCAVACRKSALICELSKIFTQGEETSAVAVEDLWLRRCTLRFPGQRD